MFTVLYHHHHCLMPLFHEKHPSPVSSQFSLPLPRSPSATANQFSVPMDLLAEHVSCNGIVQYVDFGPGFFHLV